jgi:hypothetical protein
MPSEWQPLYSLRLVGRINSLPKAGRHPRARRKREGTGSSTPPSQRAQAHLQNHPRAPPPSHPRQTRHYRARSALSREQRTTTPPLTTTTAAEAQSRQAAGRPSRAAPEPMRGRAAAAPAAARPDAAGRGAGWCRSCGRGRRGPRRDDGVRGASGARAFMERGGGGGGVYDMMLVGSIQGRWRSERSVASHVIVAARGLAIMRTLFVGLNPGVGEGWRA